jgi:small basic protein
VLQKGGPATQAFLKECLGKSEAELQDTYKELVFTGKANEPKMLASDAAVIAYVSMSKGVIAYVSASAIPMGVKKLTVK